MAESHPETIPQNNEGWLPTGNRYPSLSAVENNAMDGEFMIADPFLQVMARAADIFTKYAYGQLAEDPEGQSLSFEHTEGNAIWTLSRRLVGDIDSGQISLNLTIADKDDKTGESVAVADVAYYIDGDSGLSPATVVSTALLDPYEILPNYNDQRSVQALNFLLLLDTVEELSLK